MNYISEIAVRFILKSKYEEKIISFHNKYLNQSCFIVCNGPSLSPEDLDKIKELGIVCFAANKIYRVFDKTSWRPDFYAIDDVSIADKECIESNKKFSCKGKFFISHGWYKLRNIKDGIFVKGFWDRALLDSPKFSIDLVDGYYSIATVTYFLFQLAYYMGFRNMYIIGADNRYKYGMTREGIVYRNEGVMNHFGEKDEETPMPKCAPAIWELDIAYKYAEKFSRHNGFRIINATRGGYLNEFERVDFNELICELGKGQIDKNA